MHGWSHKEQLTTVKLMNVTGSLNLDLLKAKIEEQGRVVSWTLGKHPRFKNSLDNTITVKLMLKHEVKLPGFLPSPSTLVRSYTSCQTLHWLGICQMPTIRPCCTSLAAEEAAFSENNFQGMVTTARWSTKLCKCSMPSHVQTEIFLESLHTNEPSNSDKCSPPALEIFPN